MIKTAEVQVLTLVGHLTQLRCRLMILLILFSVEEVECDPLYNVRIQTSVF